MMHLRRVLPNLCACALAVGWASSFAQQPQARLAVALAESPRAVLPHSRTPRVQNAEDLGAVAADMPVSGITLVFRRTASQEAALEQLLTAVQTPGSPAYHQWLTPETFAARFGVANSDITATEDWLAAQGFRVDNVARSRDRITFSGTASQLQRAFGTELHHYRVEGAVHFAPASDLTLPAPLSAMTAAVLHLSDFRPKPSWKVAANATPAYTVPDTGVHYLVPADLATMYDFTPANITLNSKSLEGATQVAVVGQSYVNIAGLVTQFTVLTNASFLPVPATPVLVPFSGVEAVSLGDQGESEIDLEYIDTASADLLPLFVFVGDNQNYSVFDALSYTISENLAPVVSISYGECETLLSSTDLDQFNAVLEQAAAQGQTVVASSGDSGSTGCAPESSASGISVAQREALAVNFPASSPYVTAVGGTQMAAGTFAAGNTQYWDATDSASHLGSLLSYVPEVVWNEGSAANGITAGGGGSSSYFARPAWQTTFPGLAAGAYRLVPDISLQASIASPGYALCTSDASLLAEEGQTASCVNELAGNDGKVTSAGGTSFGAPIFASLVALLNLAEKTNGQGNMNPQLYHLAATPATYATAFHDITSGTNSCIAGAAECSAASEGNYAAQTGYDEATGLGSIDFNALQAGWPTGSTASQVATEVQITVSFEAINVANPGETALMEIVVASDDYGSGQPLPSGSVSVSIDGKVVNPTLALRPYANGQSLTTYELTAPSTSGDHLVTVTYAGDAFHAPSSETYAFQVGSVVAGGGFSLAAANLTVANNSSGISQVTVTPSGGYNGKVSWTLAVTGGSTAALDGCYAIQPLLVNNVSTTSLTIGIGTACNSASGSYQGRFRAARNSASVGAGPQKPGLPSQAVFAGLLLFGCLAGKRRRWRSMLAMLLVLGAAVAGPMGCGGGNSNTVTGTITTSPSSPTTPAVTYTMTLTGSDSVIGTITSSTTFTLSVM